MTPKEETIAKGVQLAQTAFFKQASFDINNGLWNDVKAKLAPEAVLYFETKQKESIIMAEEKKEAELKFQEIEGKLNLTVKALEEKTLAFQALEKAVSEKDAKIKELSEQVLAFQKKVKDDEWEETKKLMPEGMYFKEKEAESRKLWEENKDKFYKDILAFKAKQKEGTAPEGEEAPASGLPEVGGLGTWDPFTKTWKN